MALPAPFYQDALVTLYLGDCRDVLPQFPAGAFSWGIIDPPQRDGDAAAHDALMAQVRPLMAAACAHVAELTNMLPVLGVGQKKDDVVASRCVFLVDGVTQASARIDDPDMKLPGWASVFASHAPTSLMDCFCGAGGWAILAAKRAGVPAVGIGNDAAYLAQAAARIAAG